jgi:hypothetical protein
MKKLNKKKKKIELLEGEIKQSIKKEPRKMNRVNLLNF